MDGVRSRRAFLLGGIAAAAVAALRAAPVGAQEEGGPVVLGGVNETDQTTTFYGQGPSALKVSAVNTTAHFESRSSSTNGKALHANVPNGPGTGVSSFAPFGTALDADGAVVFRKAA